MLLKLTILLLIPFGISALNGNDVYLQRTKNGCLKTRGTLACLKYRFLKHVSSFAVGKMYWFHSENEDTNSSLNFVHLSTPMKDENGLFADSRQRDDDSEVMRFVKFMKRMANTFLQYNGISFELNQDDGPRLIERERRENGKEKGRIHHRKKKKLAILLPLLFLLKLVTVKLTLVKLTILIILIQKPFIIGALLAVYLYSKLSVCIPSPSIASHATHAHHWGEPEVGHDAGYMSHPGYFSDWTSRRFLDFDENQERFGRPFYV